MSERTSGENNAGPIASDQPSPSAVSRIADASRVTQPTSASGASSSAKSAQGSALNLFL